MAIKNLTRAETFDQFTNFFRDIGSPVDRALANHGLPILRNQLSDAYIPVDRALVMLNKLTRSEHIDDIVFCALRHKVDIDISGSKIAPPAISTSLFGELTQLIGFGQKIVPGLQISLNRADANIVIRIRLEAALHQIAGEVYEWTLAIQLIAIVRKHVGEHWCPQEIRFRPVFKPANAALEEYGNTRFLFGGHETTIRFPAWVLAPTRRKNDKADFDKSTSALDLRARMKLVLRAYVEDRCPQIQEAAEIAGMSVRTMQRQLYGHGSSYKKLVGEVRMELAAELLRETDLKAIDIAFSCGYDDPAHFSRAFKRSFGISPSECRAAVA